LYFFFVVVAFGGAKITHITFKFRGSEYIVFLCNIINDIILV